MTARQFAFVVARLIAAFLAFESIQNLPQLLVYVSMLSATQADSVFEVAGWSVRAWLGMGVGFAFWAAGPLLALVLWRRANYFADYLVEDAPELSPGGEEHPWEQSVVALLGVWILSNLLPLMTNAAFAYVQLENSAPGSIGMAALMGTSYTSAQVAGLVCQLALALFLIFRAPTAWRWTRSLQNKTMPQAVKDLREMGVAKESDPNDEV